MNKASFPWNWYWLTLGVIAVITFGPAALFLVAIPTNRIDWAYTGFFGFFWYSLPIGLTLSGVWLAALCLHLARSQPK
ncbi:hypothetical protein [Devosia salina]|uniref:DUF3311 domain-containing protein n=1 Tax=Devosia salina TaxID=2860336 RepID=A0ABX8WG61_9HYPH|nr:hypothetical protein [Devosia salina]QYO76996.1 hypothetical protein K1X15_20960 [Devosia salina]